MNVTSRDGTTIAFDVQGNGPALILVDGALTTRRSESRPELMALLAPHFAVYSYDRRGRGESGDTQPYAVEREIDDIEVLIDHAGGHAYLHGQSSGACLALHAARKLGRAKITKVVGYEAPWNDDPKVQGRWRDYRNALSEALADGRRGDAVALFIQLVGAPPDQVAAMRQAPFWPGFEAVAQTLAYDGEVIGPSIAVPRQTLAGVQVPVLAVCGGASPTFMCTTARTIAESVASGEQRTIKGQTHAVQPVALAPLLIEALKPGAEQSRAA